MEHFLHAIIQPLAILMLCVILFSFSGYIYPYFKERQGHWVWPILWIILGILAVIAWWVLVFGS